MPSQSVRERKSSRVRKEEEIPEDHDKNCIVLTTKICVQIRSENLSFEVLKAQKIVKLPLDPNSARILELPLGKLELYKSKSDDMKRQVEAVLSKCCCKKKATDKIEKKLNCEEQETEQIQGRVSLKRQLISSIDEPHQSDEGFVNDLDNMTEDETEGEREQLDLDYMPKIYHSTPKERKKPKQPKSVIFTGGKNINLLKESYLNISENSVPVLPATENDENEDLNTDEGDLNFHLSDIVPFPISPIRRDIEDYDDYYLVLTPDPDDNNPLAETFSSSVTELDPENMNITEFFEGFD